MLLSFMTYKLESGCGAEATSNNSRKSVLLAAHCVQASEGSVLHHFSRFLLKINNIHF